MTHYQKLVTIIFRVIAVLLIAASLILFVQAALAAYLVPEIQKVILSTGNLAYLPYLIYLIYLIAGMILFSSARFLAIWICLDFYKFNERK